jgi:hypothetical protein
LALLGVVLVAALTYAFTALSNDPTVPTAEVEPGENESSRAAEEGFR